MNVCEKPLTQCIVLFHYQTMECSRKEIKQPNKECAYTMLLFFCKNTPALPHRIITNNNDNGNV